MGKVKPGLSLPHTPEFSLIEKSDIYHSLQFHENMFTDLCVPRLFPNWSNQFRKNPTQSHKVKTFDIVGMTKTKQRIFVQRNKLCVYVMRTSKSSTNSKNSNYTLCWDRVGAPIDEAPALCYGCWLFRLTQTVSARVYICVCVYRVSANVIETLKQHHDCACSSRLDCPSPLLGTRIYRSFCFACSRIACDMVSAYSYTSYSSHHSKYATEPC